ASYLLALLPCLEDLVHLRRILRRSPYFSFFFCNSSGAYRHLPSFPTRRSSDLMPRTSHPSVTWFVMFWIDSYALFGSRTSRTTRSEEHTSELQSRGHPVRPPLL